MSISLSGSSPVDLGVPRRRSTSALPAHYSTVFRPPANASDAPRPPGSEGIATDLLTVHLDRWRSLLSGLVGCWRLFGRSFFLNSRGFGSRSGLTALFREVLLPRFLTF